VLARARPEEAVVSPSTVEVVAAVVEERVIVLVM
jgi:hypothetical protein